jgi:hypothetical protein
MILKEIDRKTVLKLLSILLILSTLLLNSCSNDTTTTGDKYTEFSGDWNGDVVEEMGDYSSTFKSEITIVEDKYYKYVYYNPYQIITDTSDYWYRTEVHESGVYTIGDEGAIEIELLDWNNPIYRCDSLGNNIELMSDWYLDYDNLSGFISKPNDSTLLFTVDFNNGFTSKGEYKTDGL